MAVGVAVGPVGDGVKVCVAVAVAVAVAVTVAVRVTVGVRVAGRVWLAAAVTNEPHMAASSVRNRFGPGETDRVGSDGKVGVPGGTPGSVADGVGLASCAASAAATGTGRLLNPTNQTSIPPISTSQTRFKLILRNIG